MSKPPSYRDALLLIPGVVGASVVDHLKIPGVQRTMRMSATLADGRIIELTRCGESDLEWSLLCCPPRDLAAEMFPAMKAEIERQVKRGEAEATRD